VYISFELITIKGQKKLFQEVKNVHNANTDIAGLHRGSTMLQNILISDDPSTRAESSNSSGIVDTYCLIKKMPYELTQKGIISAQYEFCHPNHVINK